MMVPEVAAAAASELASSAAEVAPASEGPVEVHRWWLGVLRARWTTLAVVPTAPGTTARAAARDLVGAARAYRLGPVRLLVAEGAQQDQIGRLLDELAAGAKGDARTVVAVDDPLARPAVLPLVVAADAALLLVRLGRSDLRAVRAAAELVGRERVGCVVLR